MRFPKLVLTLGLVAALIWPSTAAAWSRDGHMVIGAMVYRMLEEQDPEALEATLELLAAHPHYSALIEPPGDWGLDAEDRRIATLMRASRWADDTRSEPWDALSRSNWHYVNYHYDPPRLAPPGSPDRDGYLLVAAEENLAVLQGDGTDEERAIALAWLLHLVGDMHQPLHNIALFGSDHPEGDRGGNRFFVRVGSEGETIRLHALWDDLLVGSDDFRDTRNRATALRLDPGIQAALPYRDDAGDFAVWSEEGAELAVRYVYLEGRLRSGSPDAGTMVPDDYLSEARPVAERQAVLAARRLAQLLADAL